MTADVREITRKLNAIAADCPKVVAYGVYGLGLEIMRRAARVVPIDTGRLRASGFAAPPERQGTDWRVLIGYGAEYALWVHEGTGRMAGRQWLAKVIGSFSEGEALTIIATIVERSAKSEFKRIPRISSVIPKEPTSGGGGANG